MKWIDSSGKIISCLEKIKILDQNCIELQKMNLPLFDLKHTQEYRDALEDAILLNISIEYFSSNLQLYLKK
jgi:hypothetical protein